ncbi:MAG: YdcF family protein [Alphaproteobacteria bacterium]
MEKTARLLEKLLIFIGVFLIILSIVLTLIYGFSVNNTLSFLLGTVLWGIGYSYSKVSPLLKNIISFSFLSGFVILTIFLNVIIFHGVQNEVDYNERFAIILGSGIRGEKLTPMLKARLDKALEYHKHNPNIIFLVSGGQGRGEDISEAKAMAKYLSECGVPKSNIIKETKARNTIENLTFSKELLENNFIDYEKDKIVLITTDFHIFRAKSVANDKGLNVSTLSAPLELYLRPGTYLREMISISKYFILDR